MSWRWDDRWVDRFFCLMRHPVWVLLWIWAAGTGPVLAAPYDIPIRIGFTHGIFQNRNENDVLAAMMVWAETLSKEHGIHIHSQMVIYPSLSAAEEAVRDGSVDAITLLLSEYTDFADGLLSGPYFRDEKSGSTQVEFVLLGAKGGKVNEIEQLEGAVLTLHSDSETVLSTDWLSARCVQAGLGPLSSVVARVNRNEKLSGTVLGVFFAQSDACLVTRNAFDSMVELNPQVGSKLIVVAASSPVVPTLFAFRRGFSEPEKLKLLEEVKRLHETLTGEQVLHVFKSDRMCEVTAEELAVSVNRLNQWRNTEQTDNFFRSSRGADKQ